MQFDSGSNKRIYRCFVCGVDHHDYLEYVEHIVASHEEGREYLVCPRCEAPVRDMLMHFKVKHPKSPVPKGQMRTIVWKDFGGKRKTKVPKFRKGEFISAKNGGRLIKYRSGWECKCYEFLEQWNKVIAYAGEPINIPYMWHDENMQPVCKTYKPDLIVDFIDGRREVWEIKPSSQTGIEQNKAKWMSAKQYCLVRNWGFQVITEQGIEKLRILITEDRD